jgi:protein-L-isoaspartate O-methyltransferase
MNYGDHTMTAVRNHALSVSTVDLLSPMRQQARAKAEGLKEAMKRAKETGGRVRFVRSMHWAPGFFPTPPALVARMMEAASIEPGMSCLEPEAGTANIVREIVTAGGKVQCVEVVPAMANKLAADGFDVECMDFLTMEPEQRFDRVLMNPPFENRQDEAHIRHAYRFLKPGGRLVAICTVTTAARMAAWVNGLGGLIETLPADAFRTSERPTGVQTSMITLDA